MSMNLNNTAALEKKSTAASNFLRTYEKTQGRQSASDNVCIVWLFEMAIIFFDF